MSEFRFTCPSCGQHLSAGEAWVGRQIQCPACQAQSTVPPVPMAAPPKVPPPLPPIIPTAPPIPPPLRAGHAPAIPSSFSGLGFASVVLALVALPLVVIGPAVQFPVCLLACVPAIICGHMAFRQTRNGAPLRGAGWAKTGLALGYGFAALGMVAMTVDWHAASRRIIGDRGPAHQKTVRSNPPTRTSPSPTFPSPRPRDPRGSQWSSRSSSSRRSMGPPVATDPKTIEIPSTPLAGTLCGRPFQATSANLWGTLLTIEQGESPRSTAEIKIFLNTQDPASLANRTFMLSPRLESPDIKSVHYLQRSGGLVSGIAKDYAARLEFGALSGKQLPVKLYLELPQSEETQISGAFTLDLK